MKKKTAIIAVFCAVAAGSPAGTVPTRTDFPDADSVVVDDATRIEYAADGTYTAENDEMILALTEKGRRSLRTVTLGVSRRYGDAEIVKVEIIGTNGVSRTVDFRKTLKESTDNSSVSSNIYDPLDRKISCSVPGIEVGEIRRVVTRERMTKPRMRGAFAHGAVFESFRPIVRASLEIVCPRDLPVVNVKLRHPVGDTVVRSEDRILPDGRKSLRWTASDVPQAFPEPDMPSFGSVSQKLLVSTVKTWEDVSRWYWKLCQPRMEAANPAMTNKVYELVKGLEDDMDKVRAVFRFVSQEIRYMGLTLEEESPGYAPHDVSLTFDNRYGVCRDKAALLAAMLRIAGLDAYPALMRVGPKMDEDVPLPYFNHAVVAVETRDGAGTVLMDPTNENTKDILPAYLADSSYLTAHPDGRALAVVPVRPASDNAFRAVTKGFIEPDGSAVVESLAKFEGVNDIYRGRLVKLTPPERRRYFAEFLKRRYPGADLLSFQMDPEDLRDTETPLSVSLTARLPDVVVRGKTRDELMLPFVFTGFGAADILLSSGTELDSRRYPLVFGSTALSEEKLELELAGSLGVPLGMPPDIVAGRKDGCFYERLIRMNGTWLEAVRRRGVGALELPPDAYSDLKYDLKTVELESRKNPFFVSRDPAADANVRVISARRDIRLHTPFSWTVTNTWEKEILTYAGKKSSSELSFGMNPCVGDIRILSAVVSNANGNVHAVSPEEINVLDAGWAASAPRYPASKRTVVNLPAVGTGSVIRVAAVASVTNSPLAFCGLYLFDSPDIIGIKELSASGCALKVRECGLRGREGASPVRTTADYRVAVTNPPSVPRERNNPPSVLWRRNVLLSAADLRESEAALFDALEKARDRGSEAARAKATELAEGAGTAEERIKAVRDWLRKHVRVAGPGLFEVPYDKAFFPPDRSLEDGYASPADWMNLYFTMLEALGFDVEFLLTAGDSLTYPEVFRARRDVPQPDDFDDLLIRAVVTEGGWFGGLVGGTEREYILDRENEYTPLGVRNVEGTDNRAENTMVIDLNETGAARISVSNSVWGTSVGAMRKRYSEMLPEMRSRHHTELVGEISESAEAVSELHADVEGYPFVLAHSVYAPGFAVRNRDSLTLSVPGLGGRFLPSPEGERKNPFGVGSTDTSAVFVREVVFPEGYTEIEHLPPPWTVSLPGDGAVRVSFSRTASVKDGRLRILFREEHFLSPARMLPADYAAYFREINRKTGSRRSRTVVVRRGRHTGR